ncbi:MAG: ABC-F family ATP-binding cassette domain-containing protein [Candidatus Paralactobacillus gallistercoris]|uniref:ABC-F family ATP-binding cassette domain-containing protein n=1 Tax=Candidatus Paralactobacillus gallistercoris TaxID=2838724 RepID=A0A948TJW7_9LACO|nr:ABC-F family ATP-binding cassette domain-containing protein [Candidatus Paralactobacillus gallistercoris]
MILLQAQNIARTFGGEYLFKNVHLEVKDHARIAIVGPNGVGKSTLLKIIAQVEPPDEGQITLGKGITWDYLPQNSGLNSTRTVYEEMLTLFSDLQLMEKQMHHLETQLSDEKIINNHAQYQQILKQYDQLQNDFADRNGYGYEAEIRSVLHGFKFYDDVYNEPITNLSGGEKSRLALAKLLLSKKDILILDEPTNHIDVDTLGWLETYLQGYPGAVIIVSHDRYFLDHTVNEVYDLTNQHLEHYNGNYTYFVKEKQAKLDQAWRAYNKQQEEIAKLQDFINKNIVRAATTKLAQSRRKQLEKMPKLSRPSAPPRTIHFRFKADTESGKDVLQVNDAAIGYDNHIMAQPINLDVKKHDIQAIVGPNGVGKSTLLKSILHQIPWLAGEEKIGTNVHIGYYDQEQQLLHPNKTVLNEIWDDYPTTPEKEIRNALAGFLFTGDDVEKTVSQLSGGQKARLALTKLAMHHDNFLILDEPTNHLDIGSRDVLEEALRSFNGTVLFVSHDRYFINNVATAINEITPEGSTHYLGNWDYYQDKKAEMQAIAEAQAAEVAAQTKQPNNTEITVTPQQNYQQSKEAQKAKRKLSREVAKLEQQMNELTQQQQQVELAMTEANNYTDPSKMQTLQEQLATIKRQLTDIEDQWEAKELELEELE